jgi:general secretion pathway protein J
MNPRTSLSGSAVTARIRGVTLLEIMVSLGILALIATLIYGALDGMSRRARACHAHRRPLPPGPHRVGRITRELQSAFVSLHAPVNPALAHAEHDLPREGTRRAMDRSISRRSRTGGSRPQRPRVRPVRAVLFHLARTPNVSGKIDLVRREDASIDLDPDKGGPVLVVAEDVAEFELRTSIR